MNCVCQQGVNIDTVSGVLICVHPQYWICAGDCVMRYLYRLSVFCEIVFLCIDNVYWSSFCVCLSWLFIVCNSTFLMYILVVFTESIIYLRIKFLVHTVFQYVFYVYFDCLWVGDIWVFVSVNMSLVSAYLHCVCIVCFWSVCLCGLSVCICWRCVCSWVNYVYASCLYDTYIC